MKSRVFRWSVQGQESTVCRTQWPKTQFRWTSFFFISLIHFHQIGETHWYKINFQNKHLCSARMDVWFLHIFPQPFYSGLRGKGRDHQGMGRLHIKSRPSLKLYIWILFVEHFLSWTWPSCKISHSNSFSAHSNAYRQMWRSRLSKQRAYPHPLCVPGIYKGLESLAATQCIFSIMHGNDDDDGLLRMCNSRFPISFFNYFFQRILCQVI